MSCTICKRDVPIENKDTGVCATCNRDERDNSKLYDQVRLKFLEVMISVEAECPVTGTPIEIHSDIHHKMGRTGYASEEKRAMGINLLIDVDFFLAVSRKGHTFIEANEKIAIKNGWTIPRSGTHDK